MIEKLSISKSKLIRGLHTLKGRRENGMFIAEGKRLIDELKKKGLSEIEFFYCNEDAAVYLEKKFEADIYINNDEKLFATEHSQGYGAVLKIPKQLPLSNIKNEIPIIYLDGISDPGNLGSILRSMAWFGLDTLICSANTVSAFNPKAVRASMGAIFRVNVLHNINIEDTLILKRSVIALEASSNNYLGKVSLPENGIFIIGNEANGVYEKAIEHCNGMISIQGKGISESLNAAMTATVLCYELSGSLIKDR